MMTTRAGALLGAIGIVALIGAGVLVWHGGQPAHPSADEHIAATWTPAQPVEVEPFPEPPGETAQGAAYSAQESWDHVGERATVVYRIDNPYQSNKGNIFLNEKQDYRNGFTAVIFANVAHRWSSSPISMYGGKLVRVTGVIKMYEGHPEIIIESPDQIDVDE